MVHRAELFIIGFEIRLALALDLILKSGDRIFQAAVGSLECIGDAFLEGFLNAVPRLHVLQFSRFPLLVGLIEFFPHVRSDLLEVLDGLFRADHR